MGFKLEKYEFYTLAAFLLCFIIAFLTFMNTNSLKNDYDTDTLKQKLVCYYNLPHINQSLQPQRLDPFLCTHIIVGFLEINNNSIIIEERDIHVYETVVKLKQINKNLKVMLSVGGNREDSEFSAMIKNHANRKEFIGSLKNILRKYKLDGVDLDWEFPGLNPGSDGMFNNRERQHFSQLLREIRMEYVREKRDYILSTAVAAPRTIVDISYDVLELNKYVDFVNVMTYDFHFYSKFTPFTGLNAPLYASSNDILYWSTLNINFTINYWLNSGMQKEKIMVGLPTYGHSFTLLNPLNNKIQSPASGYGRLGENGFVTYPEVNWFIRHNIFVDLQFDKTSCSPYVSGGNEWISFENTRSIECKSKYIKDNKFGGAMIYSLNSDDFQANANTFPLTKIVKQILKL
ncbi:chitinase-3-like protein 2 isoform X2 [Ctenocephalides felis]|uniref:chitinase-3-like protein 2 isoform X2 n=1 Tax=Ctenocephalides felis TaxID=7515 RepID=UPI000E6E2E92|nr:chitinase-3-like protein 2 isoform X2 [Ctenocephalides felis]